MVVLIVAVVAVLLLSALSSGAEVALFSVTYSQVLSSEAEGQRGARTLRRVKENMARPIMAIVIWNNVSNIVGSIIVGAIAAEQFGDKWLGAFSAVLTLLVIIFAEIIPKTVGEQHSLRLALVVAPAVLALSGLLLPLIVLIELLVRPFTSEILITTSEAEIQALTRLGAQNEVIDEDERELIQRVFQLDDITAGDILTPLAMVDALDATLSVGEARSKVLHFNHTRLPVFRDGRLNQITGVVNVRAVLRALAEDRGEIMLDELADDVNFVPDAMPGDDLLRHFQETKAHLAVVVNGVGTVLGVVTLEDILEELVGEIDDETDITPVRILPLDEGGFRAHALCELREINSTMGSSLSEGGRLGERIVEELGRIPSRGETFNLEDLACEIDEASPRGIRWIKLTKRDEQAEQL